MRYPRGVRELRSGARGYITALSVFNVGEPSRDTRHAITRGVCRRWRSAIRVCRCGVRRGRGWRGRSCGQRPAARSRRGVPSRPGGGEGGVALGRVGPYNGRGAGWGRGESFGGGGSFKKKKKEVMCRPAEVRVVQRDAPRHRFQFVTTRRV